MHLQSGRVLALEEAAPPDYTDISKYDKSMQQDPEKGNKGHWLSVSEAGEISMPE